MGRSLALAGYLAATSRGEAWGRRKLQARLAGGKEDAARLEERTGTASQPRPAGRLLWFHAASVGESLSLLELIKRLLDVEPDLHVLMTTGTVASAEVLAARLPDRCLHQYIPLDLRPYVRRFLAHWRPDLAVWTESELWPNLIVETAAMGCKLLILNARLSDRSLRRWRLLGGAAASLLQRFTAVQAQDRATAQALRRLGLPAERIAITGTLKEGAPPPPCDEAERARLTRLTEGRPMWLAASTHPGEEAACLDAQIQAGRSLHRLLMILAPRHADRGDAVAALIQARGLGCARRSAGQDPGPETQVYLADTMGELGLWYRLAPVSFVGGSLAEIGGHNPFEPAALGSAILHGPHVHNFADIYGRLAEVGGARQVDTPSRLPAVLSEVLQPDVSAPMALAAWELCSGGTEATDKALALLQDHLPRPGTDG
jgi:3-deoxy-D-manno-octulosonic-acid transferase